MQTVEAKRLSDHSRWIAGAAVTAAAWLWAAVAFRRRDLMHRHIVSMNVLEWQPAGSGRLFDLRHRTVLSAPLETVLDGNKYAARLVSRAGRRLHPAPWYKPWRRWYSAPNSALRRGGNTASDKDGVEAFSAQQCTRFIFLKPHAAHASVMRSLINSISQLFHHGAAAQALGLPVDHGDFYLALTCEHELVWFTKTRTMLVSKQSLHRLAALVASGVELTPHNVGLEHRSNWARVMLLQEWARLYNQNRNQFWLVSIALYPKQQSNRVDLQ